MTDLELRAEVWQAHLQQWTHCLRCGLADSRLREDPDRNQQATSVPALVRAEGSRGGSPSPPETGVPLLVMYPCPDPSQERAGSIYGSRDAAGVTLSQAHGLLTWSWEALGGDVLPFPLSDVWCTVGLGCRPVKFSDPRILMKPKLEYTKACRARWQTEVLLTDPDLLVLCGRHALAAVRPDLATQHARWVGEIVPITFHTEWGVARYEGYVTVSPEEVVQNARDDQYDISEWNIGPVASHVDDPIRHWLWHLIVACWVAQTSRDVGNALPPQDAWRYLVDALAEFYDTRATVRSLAERQEALMRQILERAQAEREWRGARTLNEEADETD